MYRKHPFNMSHTFKCLYTPTTKFVIYVLINYRQKHLLRQEIGYSYEQRNKHGQLGFSSPNYTENYLIQQKPEVHV